ncbi:MAG: transposase [Muribaculum sp.]|nr:transposase [Muribaculum sp.]
MAKKKEEWIRKHPEPLSDADKNEYHKKFSQFVDRWLDANYGSCILKKPEIADIVENTLQYFNGKRYLIHSYVIMSNHIHVLLELSEGYTVQTVMHSWKSFSARAINKLMGSEGQIWTHDSFDRIIRDEFHYENVRRYIKKNQQRGGVRWMI